VIFPQFRLYRYIQDRFRVFIFFKSLCDNYGFLQSRDSQKPVDSAGNPLPWFTYPSIEFLDSLAIDKARVFEWGSGHSSAYFSGRCSSIESVESDSCWYTYQASRLKPNQSIVLCDADSADYPSQIFRGKYAKYDIIIIDGKQRLKCCQHAIKCLSHNGFLIFDNSDRYPMLCKSLREKEFLQLDFHGFGPINLYTWTTSIFVSISNHTANSCLTDQRLIKAYHPKASLRTLAPDDNYLACLPI
jgi:hypothetical protein